MLTPEELAKLQEHLVPIYQQLEDFILEDIARRLKKTGQITDMAKWQAEMAKDIGISMKRIEEEVARINEISRDEIAKLLKEAALKSMKEEEALYSEAGLTSLKLESSPLLQDYLDAVVKQTQGELINITQSMGFATTINGKIVYKEIAKTYHNVLDLAQFQISSGVLDYNTAIKRAVKSLANSGLRFVDYESGWSNRVDVAVRRATVTGANQVANKMTLANMEHLDIRYVETTAHAGARPDHQNWQGQVFCFKGKDMQYPDFHEVTKYGYGDGICGWNCRHSFHGFIPGVSTRAYSDKDLERIRELDGKIIEYKGKQYTLYQATQQQRKIETAMRKTKRELIMHNASGLKDEFTTASIKLQRQKEAYREFSKAAGLTLQNERHQVYQFDKSVSQKAVHARKRIEKEANKLYNLGDNASNVKAYLKDKDVREILSKNDIEFLKRIGESECIVKHYFPKISDVTKHIQENLENKIDRVNMTPDTAQSFIDNAKLVIYNTDRLTIKFLAEQGYAVLNFDNKLITAVPQKWRKKYDKYFEGE